jgi:hypothetical protein
MQPVAPPTHVGDLHWPVLSAVRVEGGDHPAEFVVLVDCGEPAPHEPYATLLVHVWAEHSKAEQGEYDLTFAQAKRSLAERAGLLPTTTGRGARRTRPGPSQRLHHLRRWTPPARRQDGHGPGGHARHRPGRHPDHPAWVAEHLQRADDMLSPAAARHAREVVVGYAEDLEGLEAEA